MFKMLTFLSLSIVGGIAIVTWLIHGIHYLYEGWLAGNLTEVEQIVFAVSMIVLNIILFAVCIFCGIVIYYEIKKTIENIRRVK